MLSGLVGHDDLENGKLKAHLKGLSEQEREKFFEEL
jgi:hypothetical protein